MNDKKPVAQPEPNAAPAPAPVQQWQQTPPVAAQVQYVVEQKSLDGIGGWLAFWLVISSLAGISYATAFFTALSATISTPDQILLVVFAPFLAAGFLTSVVLTSMRKKLGMWVSIGTIGAMTVYSVINAIIAASNSYSGDNLGAAIGGIVATIIFGGLMMLYFFESKRVKATLVK